MPTPEQMPEGTDQIIEGASVGEDADESSTEEGASAAPGETGAHEAPHSEAGTKGDTAPGGEAPFTASAMFERFDQIKTQGYDRAREYAQTGLDRTVTGIEDVVRMINDAADQIDEKVGAQYGDYARKAAESVGGFSELLKGKDVDDLFADAREIVKKSPGVAIGAAAALGFVVARLARAGMPDTPTTGKTGGGTKGGTSGDKSA